MFYRRQNPALFDVALKTLIERHSDIVNPEDLSLGELSDAQLALVNYLEITPEDNVTSLKGVENLKYLEVLTADGNDLSDTVDESLNCANDYYADPASFDYTRLKAIEKTYNMGQITDFSGLEKCSRLYYIDLENQRNLTHINLASFPRLKKLKLNGCTNLTSVEGITALNTFNGNSNGGYADSFQTKLSFINCPLNTFNGKTNGGYADFLQTKLSFINCHKLSSIDGIEQIIANLRSRELAQFLANGSIVLPTTTYCYLANKHPEIVAQLDQFYTTATHQNFYFVETGSITDLVTCYHTPMQMRLAKTRVDNILRTLPKTTDDAQKVAHAYNYICKNIKYSTLGKFLAFQEDETETRQRNSVSNKVASSFEALFGKRAICSGISNLLNFFLADLGYQVDIAYCSGKQKHTDPRMVVPSHQISKLFIGETPYYLDPTFDLGATPENFLLTKEEISISHGLCVSEQSSPNGQSLQSLLNYSKLFPPQSENE